MQSADESHAKETPCVGRAFRGFGWIRKTFAIPLRDFIVNCVGKEVVKQKDF